MKKKIFFIIGLLLIIAILSLCFYLKNYYSLEKVKTLLSQGNILPKNVKIIENYFDEKDNKIAHFNTYIKDNMIYTEQYDKDYKYAENFQDLNNYSILIVHDTKQIIKLPANKESLAAIGNEEFFYKLNQNAIYKYYGKENINNYNCIKISLLLENNNNIELTYFYINLEDNHIIKIENYSGSSKKDLSLKNSVIYEYTYNSVLDENILHFDINNYKDYKYDEF